MYKMLLTIKNTLFSTMFFVLLSSFVFSDPTDGCELDSNTLFLTSSGEVFYNSLEDMGGFQFSVSSDPYNSFDLIVNGASGGDAAAAGFTVSAGGTTVLGFSFTGGVIPVGCGTLTVLDLSGNAIGLSGIVISDSNGNSLVFEYYEGGVQLSCEDESACNFMEEADCIYPEDNYDCAGNCIANIDCNGVCDGNAIEDECGVCDGDGSSCSDDGGEITDGCYLPENNFYLMDGAVLYNSSQDMGGFQFNVDGTTVGGASGGDAAAAGFTVSAGGSTVLGFSFTGGVISAGCGTLTVLDLAGDAIGLSGIIVSDTQGNGLEFDYYEGFDDGGSTGGDDGGNVGVATVQVIHNSASPTVDIYLDGALAVEDFEYRSATGLLELPTSFTVGIAPADGDVIAEFPFELEDGGEYVVVATGLLGDTTTPFDLAAAGTTFGASSSDVIGLEVYHGSTDAPAVDIWANGTPLLTSFSYGDFSGFVEVPAVDYTLGVAPAGGDVIAEFTAPLSGLGGGSAVVFASGFLSGDDPAFGLFAALADGTVLTLPAVDTGDDGGDDGGEITDGCDLPENNFYLMDGAVLYNSSQDMGGFQFNIDGATATGASGGAAAAAGFTVQAAGSTVLGFSFTGGTIAAGCGTLTELALSGEATGLSGIVVSDPNGDALDFDYYDGSDDGGTDGGTTGGGEVTDGCDLPLNNIYLLTDFESGSVLYNSSEDIGGFQFNVDGGTVAGASGGDAAAAGFTVQAAGSTVLGFSFTGGTVPAGCGTLTNLDVFDNPTGLSGIVISDPLGLALDFAYFEGPCDDVDEDGICDEDDDCVGEYDDCGVCNGLGAIYDCGCEDYTDCWDGSEVCDASDCPDAPLENTTLSISNVDVETEDGEDVSDGCDLPTNSIHLLGGDVIYNFGDDVAGFQFNVDGANATGAAGGDAAVAGFTVQAAGSTVLGFSFTGGVVPVGCGTLTTLSLDGESTGLSGLVFSDSSGDALPIIYYIPGAGAINTATIDVQLFNLDPVAGFQFSIVSSFDDFTLSGASGGSAVDAGFQVSTSADGIVLGFSFTGGTIPQGDAVLTQLEATWTGSDGFIDFADVTLSDSAGDAMDYDLGEAYIIGNVSSGCTDSQADNYDPSAILDDGSCEFSGCTDPYAQNYDPNATINDGSCVYEELNAPSNLVATGGDGVIDLTWNEPTVNCDAQWDLCVESLAGTAYYDACGADDCEGGPGGACDGNVVPGLSDDCGYMAQLIGGGQCSDPCGGGGGTTGGGTTGGGDDGPCSSTFEVFGSDATVGDCYTDGTGYYSFVWEGGCLATLISYSGGDIDISGSGFTEGFFFYGFDPGSTDTFTITFDDNTSAFQTATNDCASCADQGLVECELDGSCAETQADCPQGCEDVTDPQYGATVDDCSGDGDCCPESWIGDGFPDCADQQYGCDLTCYDNDGGDCSDPLFSGLPKVSYLNHHPTIFMGQVTEMRPLDSYNVYRSTSATAGFALIAVVDGAETSYVDDSAVNGTTYYYKITSLFNGDNESDFSNTASATPMATVVISLSDAEVMNGEEVVVSIALENPENIGGLQIDLVDTPDNLTILSAEGSDRVPDDWSISVADQADGSARILGFSFTGSQINPGSGDVIYVTYSASAASEPTAVTVCTAGETISDPTGVAYLAEGGCGLVEIDVEGIEITLDVDAGPIDQGETGNINVIMDNPYDVYGLELHLEDLPESVTAIDVVPAGILADLDGNTSFSEVNGELIVLWFSLTGQFIPAGESQPLFDITYQVNDDAPDGDVVFSLTDETTFSDNFGQSMYWNSDSESVSIGLPDINLSLVQLSDDTFAINMVNNNLVSGFQFAIDDNPDYYSFVSIEATDRVPGDWSVSGNENAGDAILLGFSFQATSIEPGEGPIAVVTVDPMDMEFVSELCFGDAVVSSPTAQEYYTFSECAEFMNPFIPPQPPIVLTAVGGAGQVTLDWTDEEPSREVVELSITNYVDGQIEVSMTNTEAVGGIQFDLDSSFPDFTVSGASGGSAGDAGFTISTNPSGLVLGFSFSGATIPAGSDVLCYIDATFTGDNGTLWVSSATISDAFGSALDVGLGGDYQVGVQETYGCTDPGADNYDPDATVDNGSCEYLGCTDPLADNYDADANVNDGSCIYPPASYDIWRDGVLLASGVDGPGYVDNGLGANMTYCYVVQKIDLGQVIASSNEACATTDASVTQTVDLDPFRMNMMSLNIEPFSVDVTSVFGGLDLLLVKNDDSDYYVPDYGVNQIDGFDSREGYKVFLNGAGGQSLSVDGLPVMPDISLPLDPFRMNVLPYSLNDCMSTDIVFAGYEESLLIVKNDDSDYYVPAYNVMTLTQMCPGEGYGVFLNGTDGLDFTYPMGGGVARTASHASIEEYKLATRTDNVNATGESHLFIIDGIEGARVGDQLRAYDNEDKLVGSINIVQEHLNNSHVIDLVIHKMVDLGQYGGPVLEGCDNSVVTLKLYNAVDGKEYNVSTDNNGSCSNSDVDELSELGRATVGGVDVEVTSLKLQQNYPNPFNPTTTINFNVQMDGLVTLKIYDITGRLVRTLVNNEFRSAGNSGGYDVMWDGTDNFGSIVSAGLYLYTLQTADMTVTKKMIFMK